MVSWEWDPNYVPPVKLGLHCAQVLLSFVAWCLELAVFAGEDAKITGRNGWTFGVVRIFPVVLQEHQADKAAVLPLDTSMDVPHHDASF